MSKIASIVEGQSLRYHLRWQDSVTLGTTIEHDTNLSSEAF